MFNHRIFLTSSIEGAETLLSKQDQHLSSPFIVASSSHSFVNFLSGSWRCHLCQSRRLAECGTRDEGHPHIACQWGNALGLDFGLDAHPGLASPQKLQVWPSKRVNKRVQIFFVFVYVVYSTSLFFCFSVWGVFLAIWNWNLSFALYLLHFGAKIFHSHAICCISEPKLQIRMVFATCWFSRVSRGFNDVRMVFSLYAHIYHISIKKTKNTRKSNEIDINKYINHRRYR